jgi:flagellar motor switch protein FliN/FliY
MTESDLDNELEGLLGDEDATGDVSEDVSLDGDLAAMLDDSESGSDAGAGEDVGLDDDLAAMLDDSAAGESAEADDTESVGLDDELSGMLDDSTSDDSTSDEGGEGVTLDDDLAALTGGGAAAPAAAPAASAAPPAPAKPSTANLTERQAVNLDFLLDIKLDVTFEVGRSKMLISDLLSLGQGSVIELHRLVGDELDLLVNGKLIAKGEVIVVNEKFGCKISEIVSPEDRVNYIAGL